MSTLPQPLSEIQTDRSQITWLWRPYLAAGKLAILDGDPGTGKSMIAIDIAARLSRGGNWPDGTSVGGVFKTLLLDAEDDPDDTLRPRLIAAGGDLNHVFVPPNSGPDETLQLPRDLAKIEAMVRELKIGLVVLDPLSAFVPPGLASGGQSAARLAVAPLIGLAARTGAAILIVRHLTKQSGDSAIRRGLGSMSILGLARTGLIVGRHPRDPEISLLAITKSNLTAVPHPIGFRLKPQEGSACIDWLGPIEVSADRVCGNPDRAESPGVVRATLWLIEALANGERPAAELLAAAKADGIREKTLERAKQSLGVKSEFTRIPGQPRGWLWRPPPDEVPSTLEPLDFELEPLEDLYRKDLPKDMSKEAEQVYNHDRLEWACRNYKPKR